MSEIFVPKNTAVFIPTRQCNTNKDMWGESGKEWKPERWFTPMPESKLGERYPGIYANMCVVSLRVVYVS